MAGNKIKKKGTTDKNDDDVDGGGRSGLILLSQEEVERWREKKNHARESQFLFSTLLNFAVQVAETVKGGPG